MKRKFAPGALGLLGLLLVLLLGACAAPATVADPQAPAVAPEAVAQESVAAIPAITVFKSPT